MYKNGKSDQNYIHITPQGQVQESNPQVKIRKDLVEKMESIVKGFNKASTEDLRHLSSYVICTLESIVLLCHLLIH